MKNKNLDLLVVSYNGLIQDRSNELLENSILFKVKRAKGDKIKGILVSLSGAIYENNFKSIVDMIKHLEKINKTLGIAVNIIDYDIEFYPVLHKASKKSKIRLFKNMNAAKLFLNPKEFKQGLRVLVYDEDEVNSKELSKELSRYGYTVVRAKDESEFKKLTLEDKECDIVITHSSLNMDVQGGSSKKSLALSKKLILNLPVFMDTAVESLVSFTGLKAEKSAHGIKRFNTKLDTNIICAVMRFEGNLEGYFTLVFPTDIAAITMEALLGESVPEDDSETLKDGVGEFCNIITGSIKTAFSSKDIKIIFDLPKTYTSLKDTDSLIGQNNGVWIDMQLEGKPFYMFIT